MEQLSGQLVSSQGQRSTAPQIVIQTSFSVGNGAGVKHEALCELSVSLSYRFSQKRLLKKKKRAKLSRNWAVSEEGGSLCVRRAGPTQTPSDGRAGLPVPHRAACPPPLPPRTFTPSPAGLGQRGPRGTPNKQRRRSGKDVHSHTRNSRECLTREWFG